MDANEFTIEAQEDPQIDAFLKQVAAAAGAEVELQQPDQYMTVTGVDLLIVVAAYALWRWLKDYLDHKRARREVQVAREQERLIAALIKDGFAPKQAQAVAVALLTNLAERSADDPVLKAAEKLLEK